MPKSNALVFYSPLPYINNEEKTLLGKEIKNHNLATQLNRCLTLDMISAYNPTKEDNYDLIWYHNSNLKKFKERKNFNISKFAQIPEKRRPLKEIHSQTAKSYEKIIIINPNIPLLKKTFIKQSFEALNEHDTCIIPIEDGGWGLIGSNGFHDLYSGIKNWQPRSDDYNPFKKTLQLVASKKMTVHIGPTFFNVLCCNDIRKMFDSARYGNLLQNQYNYLKNTHSLIMQYQCELLGICN